MDVGDRDGLFRVLEQGATRKPDLMLWAIQTYVTCRNPALRDPERALAMAMEAARKNPKSAQFRLYLAFARMFTRSDAGALTLVEQASRLGADAACCSGLAAIYWLNRRDQAKARHYLGRFERELQSPGREPLRRTLHAAITAMTQGGGRPR